MMEAAVSAAAGGACAGSAALLMYAEKLPGIKKVTNKLQTDRLQAVLILTAVTGIISTPAGAWWNRMVNGLNTWSIGLVGQYTGLIVTGLAGLLVTLLLVNDVYTRKVEARTRVLAALLPVLATSIPGSVGTFVQTVLGWIVTTVARLVAGAFGVA
ncbi:hypothetical protein [Streptomyces sp. NPDC005407]|uniref:hypothetical protein n=1 Tax=Streptomyces sp. NPDC005407 TaxID=3155340 RepID=UPI0033B6C9FF